MSLKVSWSAVAFVPGRRFLERHDMDVLTGTEDQIIIDIQWKYE